MKGDEQIMAFFGRDEKKGINPLVTGVAGVIVGAAGTAAAIAMSNPKTRKMVMDRFTDARNRADKGIRYVMSRAKQMRERSKG